MEEFENGSANHKVIDRRRWDDDDDDDNNNSNNNKNNNLWNFLMMKTTRSKASFRKSIM